MDVDEWRDLFGYDVAASPCSLPCPAPECTYMPAGGDRYCDGCGTWIGCAGDSPRTTGSLKKLLVNTGALRLVGMVERAEESLNSWCQ